MSDVILLDSHWAAISLVKKVQNLLLYQQHPPIMLWDKSKMKVAQSAGAVEYTECTSAEG